MVIMYHHISLYTKSTSYFVMEKGKEFVISVLDSNIMEDFNDK